VARTGINGKPDKSGNYKGSRVNLPQPLFVKEGSKLSKDIGDYMPYRDRTGPEGKGPKVINELISDEIFKLTDYEEIFKLTDYDKYEALVKIQKAHKNQLAKIVKKLRRGE